MSNNIETYIIRKKNERITKNIMNNFEFTNLISTRSK